VVGAGVAEGAEDDGVAGQLAGQAKVKAAPTALGRWLAMVLVWGGICRSLLPKTLWRPPAIGSSAAAVRLRSTSKRGVVPGTWRARSPKKPPER
jgi:hypothetical protein